MLSVVSVCLQRSHYQIIHWICIRCCSGKGSEPPSVPRHNPTPYPLRSTPALIPPPQGGSGEGGQDQEGDPPGKDVSGPVCFVHFFSHWIVIVYLEFVIPASITNWKINIRSGFKVKCLHLTLCFYTTT